MFGSLTPITSRVWARALKRAGLEDVRWHDLRHTWASWHVQRGTPLHALQELGGWESVEMVRRYAHLAPTHLAPYANAVGTSASQPEDSSVTVRREVVDFCSMIARNSGWLQALGGFRVPCVYQFRHPGTGDALSGNEPGPARNRGPLPSRSAQPANAAMAGSSLLALIDDIATVLDDVAVLTKVATRKTAGVLGDDLALNAEQVVGVRADRELPVVWAVAKGSAVNKLILVPAALAISAFAPWAVCHC